MATPKSHIASSTPDAKIPTTSEILWAPKKKLCKLPGVTDEGVKKKLVFQNPSSPVKEYTRGWMETKTTLAPCKCYRGTEPCHQSPCKCPKKRKFKEEDLYARKKIILKCTCPVECKVLQSAQEMF